MKWAGSMMKAAKHKRVAMTSLKRRRPRPRRWIRLAQGPDHNIRIPSRRKSRFKLAKELRVDRGDTSLNSHSFRFKLVKEMRVDRGDTLPN